MLLELLQQVWKRPSKKKLPKVMRMKMQLTLSTISAASTLFTLFLVGSGQTLSLLSVVGMEKRNGNRSQKKQQGRQLQLKPWSAQGQAPAQMPRCRRRGWCCSYHPPQNSTPWAHIKHTQIKSIVSKAAAGTRALRCLQHANPGQASLALCLSEGLTRPSVGEVCHLMADYSTFTSARIRKQITGGDSSDITP